MRPERATPATAADYGVGGGAHRRIGVEQAAGEPLEQARLLRVDTEIAQLHLRAGPRQGGGAVEGGRILVLVNESQYLVAG
ncbi:hypothetical protein D3C83_90430 [compost metagenome]